MDIVKHPRGDVLELRVRGRLDSYWSMFFSAGLKEIVSRERTICGSTFPT